jgi:hypothetical protein
VDEGIKRGWMEGTWLSQRRGGPGGMEGTWLSQRREKGGDGGYLVEPEEGLSDR